MKRFKIECTKNYNFQTFFWESLRDRFVPYACKSSYLLCIHRRRGKVRHETNQPFLSSKERSSTWRRRDWLFQTKHTYKYRAFSDRLYEKRAIQHVKIYNWLWRIFKIASCNRKVDSFLFERTKNCRFWALLHFCAGRASTILFH